MNDLNQRLWDKFDFGYWVVIEMGYIKGCRTYHRNMNLLEMMNHKNVKDQNHVKNVMLIEKGSVVRMKNGTENHLELRKEGPVTLVVRMKLRY